MFGSTGHNLAPWDSCLVPEGKQIFGGSRGSIGGWCEKGISSPSTLQWLRGQLMKNILNEHKVTHIQFGRFHVMHRIYIGGYLGLIFRRIEHRKGEQQMNFGNNMASCCPS